MVELKLNLGLSEVVLAVLPPYSTWVPPHPHILGAAGILISLRAHREGHKLGAGGGGWGCCVVDYGSNPGLEGQRVCGTRQEHLGILQGEVSAFFWEKNLWFYMVF